MSSSLKIWKNFNELKQSLLFENVNFENVNFLRNSFHPESVRTMSSSEVQSLKSL